MVDFVWYIAGKDIHLICNGSIFHGQEAMIQEFLRPEFRYKLRDALDGSEGDMVKQVAWDSNWKWSPGVIWQSSLI